MASGPVNPDPEAERAFKAGGREGLKDFLNKKLNAWKETPVQIAVVGQSGAGKSSFINTIRGLEDDEDPLFAEVGVVETTMKKKSYEFPDHPLITLWDLPGAGTDKFPTEEYAETMGFSTFDAFVILSSERFTEIDKMIADEVQRIKKPFFFARTKMDEVMRNERKKKKFDASKTSDKIREDCRKYLGADRKIFLIANALQSDLEVDFPEEKFPGIRFDNMDLRVEITQSLPKMQKTAFVFLEQSLEGMHQSEKMIEMKVEQLQARIKWLAAGSAVGGAVPIPGFSAAVDIPLLLGELNFQRKQLQIDEATMEKHAKTFGPEFKKQLEETVKNKDYLVGLAAETIIKLAAAIAARVMASEVAESGLKVIPIVGWILGGIAGAALSARITYDQLTTALDAHKDIALNTANVVTKLRLGARR